MRIFTFIAILLLFFQSSFGGDYTVCETVIFKDGKLVLNGNEKVLICGMNEGPLGWKSVPLTQAEFHLKSILQNFGYLDPKFDRENGRLLVWKGSRTEIKILNVQGSDGVLDSSRKRKVVNETLTPAKLDEIEAWANLGIRSQGYACPHLAVEAQGWNGTVNLLTEIDSRKKIGTIDTGDLDGLNADVLKRYQPFLFDEYYDVRATQIMTDRLLADGLFQSAFFEKKCLQDTVNLALKTSIGLPKIVRFGIGASTEKFPFVDISFRNARLDNQASSITVSVHASPRELSFTTDTELYWFPGWHRTFFAPRFNMSREMESTYETDTTRLGADVGIKWDSWGSRFLGRGGPTLNSVKTNRGVGPTSTYPTLDGSLVMMNHLYESMVSQQYEGWTASLFYRGQGKGLGSQVDVNRYEVNYKYLWNIQEYSPPLLVLGTRFQGIIVDADDLTMQDSVALIPLEDRIFPGGDLNLRGFPRKGISNNTLGYLTFLYLGFELRLIEELPYRLQPFLLWDLGKLGSRRYIVDPALFVSEGVGLRWMSPFGTLRGSVARGRVVNRGPSLDVAEQWVYFFSFGQEF